MNRRRLLLIGLILWGLAIIFPMAWFSQVNATFGNWFDHAFAPDWVHISMHAALFAVFSSGLCIHVNVRDFRRGMAVLGLVLMVGLMQEFLQSMSRNGAFGSGEVFDLGVDLLGGLTGIAIYILGKWVVSRLAANS